MRRKIASREIGVGAFFPNIMAASLQHPHARMIAQRINALNGKSIPRAKFLI
jgi:hypothetical protein